MSRLRKFFITAALICCSSFSVAGERGYDPAVLMEPVVALVSTEMLDDLVSKSCGSEVKENRSATIERSLFAFNDQDRQRLRDGLKEAAAKRAEKWMEQLTIASSTGPSMESCLYKLGAVQGARATAENIIEKVSKRYGANTIERP